MPTLENLSGKLSKRRPRVVRRLRSLFRPLRKKSGILRSERNASCVNLERDAREVQTLTAFTGEIGENFRLRELSAVIRM